MARGINKAILVGNLGNDPETRYTQGGMAITSISLATSSVRKDREGNQVEKTSWHRVKLFGKLGEIAGEYLKKGAQVYIEGRIEYSEHTGDDGQKRYYTDIIADEMQMLGGAGGGGQRDSDRDQRQSQRSRAGAAERERSEATRGAAPAQSGFDADFADDDIPF